MWVGLLGADTETVSGVSQAYIKVCFVEVGARDLYSTSKYESLVEALGTEA